MEHNTFAGICIFTAIEFMISSAS